MSHVELYPYRTGGEVLHLSVSSENEDALVEDDRVFLQDVPDSGHVTLDLRISGPPNLASELVPDDEEPLPCAAVAVVVQSTSSRLRTLIAFEKSDDGQWHAQLELHKRDFFGTVQLKPVMFRTKEVEERLGYATHRGARLAWGLATTLEWDDDPTRSGSHLEGRWASFSEQRHLSHARGLLYG
jgi:hypothetical protein